MSNSNIDAIKLARAATTPSFDPDVLGAPYACIYRTGDELRIRNDSLGLARLYEFELDEMQIWATRPGLAHIFAVEEVAKNETTWAGMATLGWNVGGYTHIGSGRQMPGSTRIVAGAELVVDREDHYGEWVSNSPGKGSSWEAASSGMVRKMSLGHYFARPPIADLSGGKDSRLLAAAALTSGVTQTVRTVRSDHGEVETAEMLVAAFPGKVSHVVTDVSAPKSDEIRGDFASHVAATMVGTEGATVPSTALRGPAFKGYSPFLVARFNGHGGEALHGGEYSRGAWADKIAGRGVSGAMDRMAAMVGVARATSEVGRQRSMETIRERFDKGRSMGIDSASGLLNYFYSTERMPFWASSSPNRSILTPYYSSGLLHHIARTFTGPTEFEQFYSKILSSLVPTWADVPFYRPTGVKRRASKYFWQNFEWSSLRKMAIERADVSPNFESDGIRWLISQIDNETAAKPVEASFSRFIWEISLDSAISDINNRVRNLRKALKLFVSVNEVMDPSSAQIRGHGTVGVESE